MKHSTDFDFSSSILISRGLTCYILREGTRVAWHDDTPFPRRVGARVRIAYIIDKRPYRASCPYLTGLSPASPPVSIIPSHDFSYRDPEQRGYTSSKLSPLSFNFEIRCSDRISLCLSSSLVVSKIAPSDREPRSNWQFFCGRERRLGARRTRRCSSLMEH